MTKNLYMDIDVVRDASGELRANVDFSRYVGHVQEELAKKIDAAILDSMEPQLNALGWVKERTCERTWTGADMICSACAFQLNSPTANYCPNCGAKVVEE